MKNKLTIIKKWFPPLLIIVISSILRLWKISSLQYFSYDQARDYLIVFKIFSENKLTLIGPSIGIADGVYLPPFYYYLIAPFLFMSWFHLAGPDILSAVTGIAAVIVFYLIVKKLFSEKVAFIVSLVWVFNPYMIQASRHSRNPHLLPVFVLLLFYCFWRCLETKKQKYIYLSALFLGICLCLHITAVVFIPFLIFLIIKDFKYQKSLKTIIVSGLIIFILFLPLFVFDIRHNFNIFRSSTAYLFNGSGGNFISFYSIKRFVVFIFEIPVILFSGTFQNQLLSLRSWPTDTLESIRILNNINIKIFIGFILWLFILLTTFIQIKKKDKKIIIIFLFTLVGFIVSLFLPANYSFYYYFYNLFPFLFLLLVGAVSFVFSKKDKRLGYFCLLFLIICSIAQFVPDGLITETRTEKYLAGVCEIINENTGKEEKINVVYNLDDKYRWEKNAMEYRYLLKSLYNLNVLDDQQKGYEEADVLYFIDEGSTADPLTLGGMEMEAFKGRIVAGEWEVKSGQHIYKIIR